MHRCSKFRNPSLNRNYLLASIVFRSILNSSVERSRFTTVHYIQMSSSKGSAIVTGCAQGIGHAIALRLADDGFDVALNDIPSKEALLQELMKEICAKGRRSIITMGDISLEPNVEKMISEVVDQFGGLDVVRLFPLCVCHTRTIASILFMLLMKVLL